MSRVNGISDEEASFVQRFVFGQAAKSVGDVPAPLRIMAKSSGTMWGAAGWQIGFDRAASVPERLKTLACLKAASMIGCLF